MTPPAAPRVHMQLARAANAVFLVCACACQSASEPPLVQFGPAPVVGKWQTPDPASPSQSLPLGAAGAPALDPAPAPPAEPPLVGVAGRPAPAPPSAGMAGAPPMAAGGAGAAAAGSAAVGGAVRSVGFEVLTAAQGGRYQPRNIGAIWIADDSGKLIKSLKVWARIRQRHLVKYNAARTGMAIDVTATATLSSHQMHRVSWDLKDRAGAAAPPGKYRVMIEVTDKESAGVIGQFDFDTSLGPAVLTPASTPQYSMLKLQLSE